MKYKYIGVTRTQEKVSGIIEGQDETEVRLRLRAMSVRPVTIEVKKANSFDLGQFKLSDLSLSKPIDLKGMVIFTRQFSSLVDSGVPVVQCLDILFQQEKRPGFKRILKRIKDDIEAGSGLAEALQKHPRAFSDFFVRIVEAGEVSGTLDTALRRVGIQLERLGRIRAKVIGAMIYPVITVVVAAIVLIFLLLKVIPEISKLYTESSAQLPELTVQVLALSKWVQNNYMYLIVGMGGSFFIIPLLYKLHGFRKLWDPFILKVPGFGPLIRKSSIARFTRTLSTLLSSGVPLLNSFEICLRLIGNLTIKGAIHSAMQSVTEGKTIAQGLAQKNLFPPMVLHMVSIGEMTGKLDELLGKVSDIYDDELDDAVNTLTGLIQPILIIIVGAIIAFLLLAMYLPIFQLAEKVSGGG